MRKTLFIPLSAILLLAPTARAQEPATPAPIPPAAPVAPAPTPVPATPPTPPEPSHITAIYVGDDNGNKVKNGALQMKITLEANEMPLADALKQVLEQTKIPYQIEDVPGDVKVTMTLKNVPASDALSLLTREANIGWIYEKRDKDEKVSVGKKYIRNRVVFNTANATTLRTPYFDSKAVQKQVEEAMRQAREASRAAQRAYTFDLFPSYSARLPDTRVKLDVRNGNLRDILKDILKQAHLDYALDNDVPEDQKRSFTFENVPIATALDVITRSAEIGWRAQRQPTKEADKGDKKADTRDEGKVLILIGKKYARSGAASTDEMLVQPLAPNVWATPKAPASLYTVSRVEQRSTFTCPNCHRQTTIVRRTGDDREWRFCPLCGKPVESQVNLKPAPGRRGNLDLLIEDSLAPLNDLQDQFIPSSAVAEPDLDKEFEESLNEDRDILQTTTYSTAPTP